MDAFAELGVERDLRLPEEVLRKAFDRRSGEEHPDAGGTREGFGRLREAHGLLRSPGKRLRHWLELEGAEGQEAGGVPGEVMGHFGEVGEILGRAEAVARRRAAAQSALGRSLAEREAVELATDLEGLKDRLVARAGILEGRFGEFQARGAAGCGTEAAVVAAELLFLERWIGQLREAWLKLAG